VYTALYREWRPADFDGLVGQEHITQILKNQIKTGRISHAYLFSGPRGTGKTSTAKIFAKAVNCTAVKDGNPCGACAVCKELSNENNMDVIEIDAASNNGVDEIRDLREKVRYAPAVGRYKVYIIDEVHMLSAGAFNALLKTLEEPPGHAIFILATTQPGKLPATILSRCQHYQFRRIAPKVIVALLKKICKAKGIEAGAGALEDIAGWAQGGMRDAISLLDQCAGTGEVVTKESLAALLGSAQPERLFAMTDGLLGDDVVPVLEHLDAFIQEGGDLETLAADLIGHLRNVMMALILPDPADVVYGDAAVLKRYQVQAKATSRERLLRALDRLIELQAELRYSEQPRMLMEMAFVGICRPLPGESHDDLLDKLDRLERLATQGEGQSKKQEVKDVKPPPAEKPQAKEAKPKGERPKAIEIESKAEEEAATAETASAEEAPAGETVENSIKEAWVDLLKKMQKKNRPFCMALSKAHVERETKHILELVFSTEDEIYADTLNVNGKKDWLKGFIKEETGRTVDIRVRSAPVPSPEPFPVWEDAREEAPEDVPEEAEQRVMDFFDAEYVDVRDN
jgi:DNA polymerase-3 subunit gamma/tau